MIATLLRMHPPEARAVVEGLVRLQPTRLAAVVLVQQVLLRAAEGRACQPGSAMVRRAQMTARAVQVRGKDQEPRLSRPALQEE